MKQLVFKLSNFFGLKPKNYLFLVDDSNEDKKAIDVNKTVVAAIIHNEYNDVFLNRE